MSVIHSIIWQKWTGEEEGQKKNSEEDIQW